MKRKIGSSLVLILGLTVLISCGGSKTSEVSIDNLKTEESAFNNRLVTLSFDFSNESGDKYSCTVSGIEAEKSFFNNGQEELAENIASHFAGGSPARIDAGEDFDLIDAEKYSGKNNSSNGKSQYGDSELCWAASTSDMLVHAGWMDNDEDTVFSDFVENYYNCGSYQKTGLKFYFSGINQDQEAQEKAGKDTCRNAVFADSSKDDLFSSTQVRNPGTDSNGKINNTGHHTEYVAEKLFSEINTSNLTREETGAILMDAIDNGSAVGLTIVFYKGDSRVGVHAITAMGYIKDANGNLQAVIVSDSDNDMDWGREYTESAEQSLSERQEISNSYDMFLTEDFDHNESTFLAMKDYKYSGKKLKYDNAIINMLTVLKPASESGSGDLETSGTMDAANTPDMYLRSAESADQDTNLKAKAGEEVAVPFVVSNISYRGYAASDKAVAKCTMHVFKDGKKVGEKALTISFVTDSYTTGEANFAFVATAPYTFESAGEYTVDIEIEGVYSGTRLLPEAYTGNNYLKDAARIVIS